MKADHLLITEIQICAQEAKAALAAGRRAKAHLAVGMANNLMDLFRIRSTAGSAGSQSNNSTFNRLKNHGK